MKRTHPTSLIGLGALGVALGFLVEVTAAGHGVPTVIPPFSLPLTLFVIAAFVVALAVPIRQATHGKANGRIDPFQAARVAVFAKACSLAGGLLAGAGAGIVVFLLTRSVAPGTGALWQSIAAFLGSVALLVGGLIAEHLCTLPPGPREPEDDHA